ncbi:hypothetical protein BY996DRAFT_6411892 [Phakopsora pachyrhizi]|uniref:Expressed protein n=1 Tax=Phakopsora pachyrhizi TaxID=170000 RepID=A0AAV0AZA0_PHAPC|nr:hypothetical protein BY996DRAFT_6411892 [Phakopsora pachyrhizi]CAH7675920.1 expressed protein [Phakopsora pachyrhizi]
MTKIISHNQLSRSNAGLISYTIMLSVLLAIALFTKSNDSMAVANFKGAGGTTETLQVIAASTPSEVLAPRPFGPANGDPPIDPTMIECKIHGVAPTCEICGNCIGCCGGH